MRSLGADVERLTVSDNGLLIAESLILNRKILKIAHISTAFRGPRWYTTDRNKQIIALQALRQNWPHHKWRFFLISPEWDTEGADHSLFEVAGFKRVMTGFSTIWLDLRPNEEDLRRALNGKWRNQLKRAEQSGVTIHSSTKTKHYEWLLEKETEQRRERRYQGLPNGLVTAFANSKEEPGVLSVTAHLRGQKVAGALFLLHGHSATYHIGYSSAAGRGENAQNHVLFESLKALKAQGIHFLDLGGLNTDKLRGLARFKLGLGAPPRTMAGTFL